MKNSKRAFTIVELVIVIAVIAILAAVLIPTFSGLIEKANVNSDQAAVKQMNTYLASDEQINGKPGSWQEAVKVLNKSSLDVNGYSALSSGYKFVYDESLNRVLYVDSSTETVVYPAEYTAEGMLKLNYKYGSWKTLTGEIVADDSWRSNVSTDLKDFSNSEIKVSDSLTYVVNGETKTGTDLKNYIDAKKNEGSYINYYGESANLSSQAANLFAMEFKQQNKTQMAKYKEFTFAKVNTAEQLKSYIEYVQKNDNADGKNYTLMLDGDIDLGGTEWKPLGIYAGNIDGSDGKGGDYKVSNLTMTDSSAEVMMYPNSSNNGGNFYYGFISVFEGTYLGNITFENVNIVSPGLKAENTYGFSRNGHITGALCGLVNNWDDKEVVIENIHVLGGKVQGLSRVGSIIGRLGSNSLDDLKDLVDKYNKADGSIGMNGGSITVRNCTNKAEVISESSVSAGYSTAGGFIGSIQRVYKGSINLENLTNEGNVTGQTAGGICGVIVNASGQNTLYKFEKCTNTGKINGRLVNEHGDYNKSSKTYVSTKDTASDYSVVYAGGILGTVQSTPKLLFKDCTNSGVVALTNLYTTQNAKTYAKQLNAYAISQIYEGVTFEGTTTTDKFEFNVSYASKILVSYHTNILSESNYKQFITTSGLYFSDSNKPNIEFIG